MNPQRYRAAAGTYALAGAVCGLACVLWSLAIWRFGAPWLPLVLPLGAFALVVLWLSRFGLTLANGELTLVAPFRSPSRLALADILSIEFATETADTESPFVLSIRTSSGEDLRLNTRVFPTEAAQSLLALSPRRASAPKARQQETTQSNSSVWRLRPPRAAG